MAQPESVQLANTQYEIFISGGDVVFLKDILSGHKILIPTGQLTGIEFRRFVDSLSHDLRTLPLEDFHKKHRLQS